METVLLFLHEFFEGLPRLSDQQIHSQKRMRLPADVRERHRLEVLMEQQEKMKIKIAEARAKVEQLKHENNDAKNLGGIKRRIRGSRR